MENVYSSPPVQNALDPTSTGYVPRRYTIDVIRALAMIFMALDHSRDYFTSIPFEPELISQTFPALFLTRWITHFCAPAFFVTAGTGAYIYGSRHGIPKLTRFLWTRGLWLVFLEFVVVGTAWTFQFPGGFFGVIWSLGTSMLLLSLVTRFSARAVGTVSVGIICLHDIFDGLKASQFGSAAPIWALLHSKGPLLYGPIHSFVLFPVIPWVAVMGLGYWLGSLYRLEVNKAARYLKIIGYSCIACFVLLRLTNVYGNPPAGLGGVFAGELVSSTYLGKDADSVSRRRKVPTLLAVSTYDPGPHTGAARLNVEESSPSGKPSVGFWSGSNIVLYMPSLSDSRAGADRPFSCDRPDPRGRSPPSLSTSRPQFSAVAP